MFTGNGNGASQPSHDHSDTAYVPGLQQNLPRAPATMKSDENDGSNGNFETVRSFHVDELVWCPVEKFGLPKVEAMVVAIGDGGVGGDYYIHFVDRDRRLDRWASREELSARKKGEGAYGISKTETGAADASGERLGLDQSQQQGGSQPEMEIEKKFTRSRRRLIEQLHPVSEKEQGSEFVAKMERAREERTKVKNFSTAIFAPYTITVWYFAPYPLPPSRDIFVCPACLKYTTKLQTYRYHLSTCQWTTPPGSRIYEDVSRGVSVYEVDGVVNAPYCQRLCLLGKLFLDHKTLYFDVAPFLFYVITTTTSSGHLVSGVPKVALKEELSAFFSKEKSLVKSEYNLACILTLPQHQRKGLGRFMIALSYELTKREGKTAGPERPLSDLGQVSYRSFWNHSIVKFMRRRRGALNVSVNEVARETGIRCADVVSSLKMLNMVNIWKGEMYVSSSAKVVDEAAKRVSEPRLPFVKSVLKWEDPSKIRKNKILSEFTEPSVGKTRKAPASRNPVGSPKKKARRDSKSGLYTGAFSEEEVAQMMAFVKQHGAERIVAPLNTKDGIPSSLVHELAESMEMSMERCRKKLKRIASAAVEDGLDFYPASKAGESSEMKVSMVHVGRRNHSTGASVYQQSAGSAFVSEEELLMEDGFDRGKVESSASPNDSRGE